MACKEDTTLIALRNLAQCPICIDTFDDARLLPCAHSFCLKCLKKTLSKTKAQCAMCRKPFDIPVGGLNELPKNTMIQNLIDLSKQPRSSENSGTLEVNKVTMDKPAKPGVSPENTNCTGTKLSALPCGNCGSCELCAGAQDARDNEEVHVRNTSSDQMIEPSIKETETPEPEDTENLCDICVLNNVDGNQKVSIAALYCKDCNENQCEKCSAQHMRQRLCKSHTVVTLEDHFKEKQREESEKAQVDEIPCDVCLDNNESGTAVIALATLYCIDCTENQCDDCSREHKRQRLCKDHQIVVLDDQMRDKILKLKEIARSTNEDNIFCDICAENGAPQVTATKHCADCDENQCDDCSREHKRQRLCKDHQIVVLDDQMRDKILKLKEIASSTNEDNIFCDICAENGAPQVTATKHCADCDENQCDDCSREHTRQRLFKSHKCMALDDQIKKTLQKARQVVNATEVNTFCDICKENNKIGSEINAATLYCTDCKENQCENCSKEHKRQRKFRNHQIIVLDAQVKDMLLGVKEMNKKPDVVIICDVCAENSSLGEEWLAATLHCMECDENQCVSCNKEHKKQSSFRNHEIVQIDECMKRNLYRMKSEADISCDMCAGYCADQSTVLLKATSYCVDCQENQCEECKRSHLKQKQFRGHKVIALDEQKQQKEKHSLMCSIHAEYKQKFYCVTCQQVTCMKCLEKEHDSHEYQFACTVADGFLNEIDVYFEKMNSWLQQGDATKHELQVRILEDDDALRARRKHYHGQIPEDLCSKKGQQLNTRIELKKELDEHLTNLSAFKRRCIELKTHKSSVNICLAMDELRTKFEELRRQEELCSPKRLLPRAASSLSDCNSNDPTSLYYDYRRQMKEVVENKLRNMLKDEAYSKIRKMIERPQIHEEDINQFWCRAFPYIIQRIKMWNGNVLTAENIADLMVRRHKKKELLADSQTSVSSTRTLHETKTSGVSIYPVSRLDCLTYLINVADCIVAHDILRIMSKFPMAIPLIVKDIHEDDKYIVTVPIIQNTLIKWESNPGQIIENHLFTSPFQMVAAIRLGSNKIGKSTILNQLMSRPFLFSSKGEAGSGYGRPFTLSGAVEIVWLIQETCSSPTWKTAMSEYYSGSTEAVAILANLHGSAIRHPETIKYLKKFICSFVVFLMPDFSQNEWAQLKQQINGTNYIQVFVDPEATKDEENYINTIRTDSLSSDDTLLKMRCLLKESFRCIHAKKTPVSMDEIHNPCQSLKYAEPLHYRKSTEIMEIVENHGCLNIKELLCNADIKEHAKWDYSLKRLVKLTLDMFGHPAKDAKKYLTHLETNLSKMSTNESLAARTEVSEANEKVRRILKVPCRTANSGNSEDSQIEIDLKKAKNELRAAMVKVDTINLGQEHFFRALGQMYENSFGVADIGDFKAIFNLPNNFADLLISGHAIEMLNGDSGQIQLIWIKAICDCVFKRLPNLKVFVISIIGLQSSGKSTLLNALFSCRFAVSVGRCSRGLFMRMIFLEEKLKNSLGCHAIILIDTEGLSSPEKMNDPKANQKDRLMATFAMGISNLTIVNILGEGMTEMTEILQIAIVAMARLRGGGIKPDILMVQHLQERNLAKIDQAKGQFCEAINKSFELISKNDVEIGSASAECLAELTARIHSGDLFQHFGPFRDGSSVNSPPSEGYHNDVASLLETILERTEVSESKTSFERWCNHFESYWACVQEETFALNFKNAKHITDFLYFEKKIARVKELLDQAIRYHRDIFSRKIIKQVGAQISEKRKPQTDSVQRQNNVKEIEQQMQLIPHSCPSNCEACRQFNDSHTALLEELNNSELKEDSLSSLERYNIRLHEISMKTLTQTFDGSLVRQGCFFDFSVRIATELKTALLEKPNGHYSKEEQKLISEMIWKDLQKSAAEMESGPTLEIRLNQILHQEYSGVWPTVFKDLKLDISIEYLAKSSASSSFLSKIGFVSSKLGGDQMLNLMSTISQMVDAVFGRRCVNFNKTGLDFEESMVREIRIAFSSSIKQFEDRFRMKLSDAFKIDLQIYALQYFRKKMAGLQELWDSQNKPSEILKQKKLDYMTEIETRLQSGFSSAGEGQIVARRLYNALKKMAVQAAYDEKVQLIKSMPWTTNSEKVRLCYFQELAEEVQAGNKLRALMYFKSPKTEIQSWFKQRIDSFDDGGRVTKIYKSSLKRELGRLMQNISNATSEIEINGIIREHLKAGDDPYNSKVDPKEYDFDSFKGNIEHKLKYLCELDDKEDIVVPLASVDSEIMGRLGCTESCFWCGALCWGSRDHQLEKDRLTEIEAHHSCHQPSGLRGLTNKVSLKLISTACHNIPDGGHVWFREYQDDEGMLWSEAKQNHFKDWKFDAHCTTKFDELMRWFFQELHQDIARNRGVLPADRKDLKQNKCIHLKLSEILITVRSKI